jgi:hypothetical protein
VIAVTGFAGHAFGSWRNCETHQMWLKDFLPQDIQNIRIMSYGYDSSLVGQGEAGDRLLDYQRLFIQDIENARSSVKVGWCVSVSLNNNDVLTVSYKENPTYHIHRT